MKKTLAYARAHRNTHGKIQVDVNDSYIVFPFGVKLKDFDYWGIQHNCYIAPAGQWATENFPQEPIEIDGEEWVIFELDDYPMLVLSAPSPLKLFSADGASYYCPYVPLQFVGVKRVNEETIFKTRYGLDSEL